LKWPTFLVPEKLVNEYVEKFDALVRRIFEGSLRQKVVEFQQNSALQQKYFFSYLVESIYYQIRLTIESKMI
jgi:hypothetical protein